MAIRGVTRVAERYGTEGNQRLTINQAIGRARQGIQFYLARQLKAGIISQSAFDSSLKAIPSIERWLTDPHIHKLSPNTRTGIVDAIINKRWGELVDAHYTEMGFGTAGIRGKAVNRPQDLERLFKEGIGIPLLKGPNWISDLVIARVTQGVMNWMTTNKLESIAIGYDSRVGGKQFAEMVARIAIANGKKVFLFDKPSPFPSMTYGNTLKEIRADIGILVSASHNGAGDNGYKVILQDGSQFDTPTRNAAMKIIQDTEFADVVMADSLAEAKERKLIWLGADKPVAGHNYYGREKTLIDVDSQHIEGMRSHIVDQAMLDANVGNLRVGYSAYNGAGNLIGPKAMLGFGVRAENFFPISNLQEIDGRFPLFAIEKDGKTVWQQPDPGGPFGADKAVEALIAEHGPEVFKSLNFQFGLDPDADRAGFIIPLPKSYQAAFGSDRYLIPANLHWATLLDYRLGAQARLNGGRIPNADKKYAMISHATSPWIAEVAKHHGIAMKGRLADTEGRLLNVPFNHERFWVGMNNAAEIAKELRLEGFENEMVAEESNGLSKSGGPVEPGELLGRNGWVLDKDGLWAGALTLELFAYLRSQGIFYLDQVANIAGRLGNYMGTANQALPSGSPWVGPAGTERKVTLLKQAEAWANAHLAGEEIIIGGKKVKDIAFYRTGKYDNLLYSNAPDQGVHFWFEDGSSFICRPSGTANQLRFYTFAVSPAEKMAELGTPEYLARTNKEAIKLGRDLQIEAQLAIGIPKDKLD
jgi:phosphoglucomutase